MKYCKTRDVRSPNRGTPKSAGIDLYVPLDWPRQTDPRDGGAEFYDDHVVVHPQTSVLIPSGIRFNVPEGHALIAFNKSGVAVKRGLQVGACVVDEDYTGEVQLHLTNVSERACKVQRGDKLVQFILLPVTYAEPAEMDVDGVFNGKHSERGDGKFGSTGEK